MLVVCALGIGGAVAFSRTVVKPLDNAVRVSQAVAGGDLTVATEVRGKDEIAQLLNALYGMQMSLSRVVSNVRSNANSVAAASSEIAHGNNDLSARTEQQASALEETSASMEEMSSSVTQNAENAKVTDSMAVKSAREAGEGGEAAAPSGIGYYTLDPEFITNFLSDGPTLGYVRVKVDLMVDNAADIELLKRHDPLLRDAINTLLGSQTLEEVKSQEGREKVRLKCKAKVEELLTKEEGRKVIRDLLFTNYLYQ